MRNIFQKIRDKFLNAFYAPAWFVKNDFLPALSFKLMHYGLIHFVCNIVPTRKDNCCFLDH